MNSNIVIESGATTPQCGYCGSIMAQEDNYPFKKVLDRGYQLIVCTSSYCERHNIKMRLPIKDLNLEPDEK